MNLYRFAAAAAVVGSSLLGVGSAWAQHSALDHLMVRPDDLRWADNPSLPPGAKIAMIQGPMNQAVPFTARLRFPANYMIPPHPHPAIEQVTVLCGTFHIGAGESFDQSETTALTPASMAIMQTRTPHFAWTKEEKVVQIHAVGLWGVEYVNPADDPCKQ